MAPGGFVKKILSLPSLATLAIVLGMITWGSVLNAQTTPSTTPDQQTQQPASPDATPSQQTPQTQPTPSPEMPPASQQTPSSQTPSSQTPSSQQPPDTTAPESGAKSGSAASENANGSQTFSGTVVKQGDKYVLKDDTGKVYDIDHQTDVAKFEGKRVRVQGTLDSNGKILVK